MNPLALLHTAQQLAARGVLGINRRNAEYISRYNPRRQYPLVDDKERTKKLALAHGVAVPELYAVVRTPAEIPQLHRLIAEREEFVIKPASGSGGEGVIVVTGKVADGFRTIDGAVLSRAELNHHITKILGGLYSLGGQPDRMLCEYRVRFDRAFEAVSYLGVPDVRIIVFLGVPVMAMIRLPTKASHGKANLHQGAVGAGIQIDTGCTCAAVWRNRAVRVHPDTGVAVVGLAIPQWHTLLELASRLGTMSGLGYVGADIVLDADRGPLLLELNARPGLSIQIANHRGITPRLQLVERAVELRDAEVSAKLAFAQRHFGAEL